MASLGLTPISNPHTLSEEQVYNAWTEYTGLPAALVGGMGFVAGQLGMQSIQARIGMHYGVYGAGQTFKGALTIEMIGGTIGLATLLTLIDPEHKIEGFGLDETKFYQKHLEGRLTQIKARSAEAWNAGEVITPRGKWFA